MILLRASPLQTGTPFRGMLGSLVQLGTPSAGGHSRSISNSGSQNSVYNLPLAHGQHIVSLASNLFINWTSLTSKKFGQYLTFFHKL